MDMRVLEIEPAASAFSRDEERWQAVVTRDRRADGRFYYAVGTTGVYCRPSCGARTPNRRNVSFHLSCAEAEGAGFRACKRCRPGEAGLAERQVAMVTAACRQIEQSDQPPSLAALAATAGISRFHFQRIFKAALGVTPKDYAAAHRAERARQALGQSATVTEAIYDAGFNANSRFYAGSTGRLGMTPRRFRAGGVSETIRFAVAESSLGAVLVAATDKGIAAIYLGDDPEALVRELQDRFPNAQLIGGDAVFERMVARVIAFVEAPSKGLDLPLDIRGTAFQQRVWAALCAVPAGETASYRAIAARIGAPKAVRAVAGACAANAIAVAIPCHRIVRTDGGLSGYRWGVERKRALLDREAKA
jgi:AraC family transcriptional regulator of adaptative response/methylated-DNA-[protein]-cysteine methyltransferase